MRRDVKKVWNLEATVVSEVPGALRPAVAKLVKWLWQTLETVVEISVHSGRGHELEGENCI